VHAVKTSFSYLNVPLLNLNIILYLKICQATFYVHAVYCGTSPINNEILYVLCVSGVH